MVGGEESRSAAHRGAARGRHFALRFTLYRSIAAANPLPLAHHFSINTGRFHGPRCFSTAAVYDPPPPRLTHRVSAGSDWAAAVLWSELASYQFFATGHQATFPSIQWESAVTGLQMIPDGTVLPGLCVLASTFAGELVAAFTLPLVLCAPHLIQVKHAGSLDAVLTERNVNDT